ncbi:hypothetical protein QBC47DRAFT_373805 [Echria macrotheca]|uniref:Orc1-like AAA ATPase domain-containing protein n=1 Tax=Echria macrotheca TaxID=438768 RepID=A0AAJ0FCA4_9PEZI|nr:hypothetical protein QBC47DRAFT_373805 [Echria macrotheca]
MQTLLLENLPDLITKRDIESFFANRIHTKRRYVKAVGNVGHIWKPANSNTKRAVVTFDSPKTAGEALALNHAQITAEAAMPQDPSGKSFVRITSGFYGLIVLYEPPASETPNLDITLVHGLKGHAWNTFAREETLPDSRGIGNPCWMRDELPSQLRTRGIFPRLLTYGYNANVWGETVEGDISEPVVTLCELLKSEREGDPERPLIFIAHSLGGLVSKQAIVEISKTSAPSQNSIWIKGCIFLGVPHNGAKLADWAGILAPLVGNFGGLVQTGKIKNLEQKCEILNRISDEFRQVRHAHNIPVLSCYETKKISRVYSRLVVEKESAILSYENCPSPLPVDTNHVDMVRTRTDAIANAILTMALDATKGLVPNTSVRVSTQPAAIPVTAQAGDVPGIRVPEHQESEAEIPNTLQAIVPQNSSTEVTLPNEESSASQRYMVAENRALAHRPRWVNDIVSTRQCRHSDPFRIPYDSRGHSLSRIFVGRDDEMKKLAEPFLPPSPSRKKVCAVYGLGGIGKSQLVAQFAHRYRATFTAIFWIKGATKESFTRDLARIASLVKPNVPKGDQERLCKEADDWLKEEQNYKWLMIVDNVDLESGGVQSTSRYYELDKLLPGADHGSILITTRDASLKQKFESLELQPFKSEEGAVELLAAVSGRPSQDLGPIASRLGGLPLALEQAGSFLRETSFTVDEYLAAWETEWERLVDEMASDDPSKSIRTTWVISLEYVKGRGPDGENAAKLLQLFSFFNNTEIEHDLLTRPSTTLWEPFTIDDLPAWFQDIAQSSLSLNRAIRMLGKYSLIQQPSADKYCSVHPVVHEWSYYVGQGMHADLCRTAAIVIASGAVYHGDMTVVRQNFKLIPHLRRIIQILTEKSIPDGPRRALEHESTREALTLMGVVFRQSATLRSEGDQLAMATGVPKADPDTGYASLMQLLAGSRRI